ncbi:conserved hypothetical protein [Neospora caninum Liverpool]|uniref:Uncharacterized protein n=1 Tax=Neospora caninum (strain Liverpool) TaxID=572307 RepID=F0VBV3_NEOCL|nr:conserved hypothetical protein [Neospora caninum Liverpool]CBZ51087.1 conserved hypothetical protein [Neospora caninum Liverpool]CEL68394.1 TPA: hypothetical protein BN1204_041620 [Neospora caninum Liverpool]|eukprot:XP_003881120.1 conserved hypothetical protein [Neospora caninum Liverpool]
MYASRRFPFEKSDKAENAQPSAQQCLSQTKPLWKGSAAIFFGCPEDYEMQRRTFPGGCILRLLLSGRMEILFPDGTFASRNPTPEEFFGRVSSNDLPPARHLASLGISFSAKMEAFSIDDELSLDPEVVCEAFANAGRGMETSSWFSRLDFAFASHGKTRSVGEAWRAYDLPPIKQAVYPDFQSNTQVVLNEDRAVRIEWRKPADSQKKAKQKKEREDGDDARPLCCRSEILVQAADGTRIALSVSASETPGEINERATRVTSIAIFRKQEWTVTVREDDQVDVEWTTGGNSQGCEAETARRYSCFLRRKEIVTAAETGETYIINAEGDVEIHPNAAGEETLSVPQPSPGFASPLTRQLTATQLEEDANLCKEKQDFWTLGPLRLFAVSCETGEAEEILDRAEVEAYLEQSQADPKSMVAPETVATDFREKREKPESAFTVFRTFLEYPEAEPERWRDFQERYFRYLQWEATKARHNIPYLVSPDVADFFLSNQERLSADRAEKEHSRKGKQQRNNAAREASLAFSLLRLPSSVLSVQALELKCLLLRGQVIPPRRQEEWLREALETLKSCKPTVESPPGTRPTVSDGGGLRPAPAFAADAPPERRARLQRSTSFSECFWESAQELEGKEERNFASFDLEQDQQKRETRGAAEETDKDSLHGKDLPPVAVCEAPFSGGKSSEDPSASAQREAQQDEGVSCSGHRAVFSPEIVSLERTGKASREMPSGAINAVDPLHWGVTPWADDGLALESGRVSRESSRLSTDFVRTGDAESEATHRVPEESVADRQAAQACGKGAPTREKSAFSRQRREGEEKGNECKDHSHALEERSRGERLRKSRQPKERDTEELDIRVKSSVYNVYGKPREKDGFCCRDSFISKMIVARKDLDATCGFLPNEKYQMTEAPVDRKIKTASLFPKTQREASQDSPQRLVEVFPRRLDFGACKVGERMRSGTRVRNLDSDVCRFSVVLEHTGPDDGYDIQLFYTAGRIAPGLCLEILAELVAHRPGPVSAVILVTHKAHLIRIPVTAEAV